MTAIPEQADPRRREHLLRTLSAATFIIFFQAFMVAPLFPRLALDLKASIHDIGLIVPAYLIPYGIATIFYGVLSDRFGLRRIMFASLGWFVVLTALTATARSATELLLWRLLTGLGASGVVPLALVLVALLYPYEQRGRPLGWLFGAMAGGMAFGSTFGAVAEPLLGWRGLFVVVSAAGAVMLLVLRRYWEMLGRRTATGSLYESLSAYRSLLGSARGLRTYGYVLLNAIFHSGVYTWLGVYFARRYGLGEMGIGLALLGYGVPGFILGPVIGRVADRWGRGPLIPLGVIAGALSAASLVSGMPVLAAGAAVTVLSLGYDMTQPLLAGIVTSFGGKRPGQAMGLNVFCLFLGFGLGSFIFGEALRLGFSVALGAFSAVQLLAGLAAIWLFGEETPKGVLVAERSP